MNTIKIYDDKNELKEYKVLLVIDMENKYVIYTNIDNDNPHKDLMVAKLKSLKGENETLPITDAEWEMIEQEYLKVINASN